MTTQFRRAVCLGALPVATRTPHGISNSVQASGLPSAAGAQEVRSVSASSLLALLGGELLNPNSSFLYLLMIIGIALGLMLWINLAFYGLHPRTDSLSSLSNGWFLQKALSFRSCICLSVSVGVCA